MEEQLNNTDALMLTEKSGYVVHTTQFCAHKLSCIVFLKWLSQFATQYIHETYDGPDNHTGVNNANSRIVYTRTSVRPQFSLWMTYQTQLAIRKLHNYMFQTIKILD